MYDFHDNNHNNRQFWSITQTHRIRRKLFLVRYLWCNFNTVQSTETIIQNKQLTTQNGDFTFTTRAYGYSHRISMTYIDFCRTPDIDSISVRYWNFKTHGNLHSAISKRYRPDIGIPDIGQPISFRYRSTPFVIGLSLVMPAGQSINQSINQ